MPKKKKFIMLVGLPGSGKSTWANNMPDCVVVSRDFFIEEIARRQGLSYQEAFQIAPQKEINQKLEETLQKALQGDKDVILDMTNLTVASRKSRIAQVSNSFQKIAYVFMVSRGELQNRLQNRSNKIIPDFIISRMRSSFQMPSKIEGFDRIIIISNE